MNADIIIIGGGVIGCAIGAELAARGLTVRLFERNQPGLEASWASAGMIAPQSEAEQDGPMFQLCQQSRDLYVDFVNKLKELTGLDPCLRTEGALEVVFDETGAQALESAHAWQFQAGLAIERLCGDDARKLEPALAPSVIAAHYFPREYQVDNRKLTEALIVAAHRRGVEIVSGAQVTEIVIEHGRVRGVVVNGERHDAEIVINAAGSWASLLNTSSYHLPVITPVRGQMVALKLPANKLNLVLHSNHHYIVPRWDGTVLAGSTMEFVGYDKSVTAEGLNLLLSRAQTVVPALAQAQFISAWAGLRPASADGLPLLGAHPEVKGLVFATGHYRNGILLTPITARLIADLITTRSDTSAFAPFSPSRFAVAK